MTVVSCSVDERYVNPLFEVFDGGDFILSSYRDVEDVRTTMQIFFPDSADAPRAVAALVAAGEIAELFNRLIAEGKILSYGVSNWRHERIIEVNGYAVGRFFAVGHPVAAGRLPTICRFPGIC